MIQIFKNIAFWFKNLFTSKKPVHKNPIVSKKRVMKGLKVWEGDLISGDVVEAEIEITFSFDANGKSRRNRKVLIRKNCIYEYALNGENACRKLELRIANIVKTTK
jgi:hypothetical protein